MCVIDNLLTLHLDAFVETPWFNDGSDAMCCATLIPTFLLLCLTSYFNKEEEERSDDEAVASIETESQKDKQ